MRWICKPMILLIASGVCLGRFEADLNDDRYVGLDDLAVMASYWIDDDNSDCRGDTGGDCWVDMEDMAMLARQWQWMECLSTASASSRENGSLGPANAIDGSMNTRWSSDFYDNQWLQIDLGQRRNIYGLTIHWETAYARVYNVQVSDDGIAWTTVFSETNGNGGIDDITFAEVSAVYLRINCITRATPYGSSIWEVELRSDDACHTPPTEWALVWSDEFDGTSLNPANWECMIGDGCSYGICGWGNDELQYYRSRNVWVQGGVLIIESRRENYGGKQFTSGRIRSANKQDFLYGRMEARIKVPTGGGMWPAFWMMPTDSVYGGWAASGEIDIMETCNETDYIGGTIHYGGPWPDNRWSSSSYEPAGMDFSDDFHVYSLEWEPDVMRWYVDGVLYSTKTSGQWYSTAAPGNDRAPFDQEFHFLLNVAVGGNYTGCTSPSCITADFPQQMLVDWVRVYQKAEP